MFAIAAINDTSSKEQWEPLAPTKEAQEFQLSQIYHEGLIKLQAKEYEKARELLESVLKDPLITSAKVESCSSDNHLLQLRFLALKNLANVFRQQGPAHYENALRCYLQAVEIDTKDSVIWNQLGTLSCSMGLLSISRWAFEQGLFCSPNNWNCMEKLLEVLIAIGDEVSCLSVAEVILRRWPSHARASHVKNTIEDSEPIPFTPRGIDKLEPKHARLTFLDKRKSIEENIDDGVEPKKLKQQIELTLKEASWTSLSDALSRTLLGQTSQQGSGKIYRSGDISLSIKVPHELENFKTTPTSETTPSSICNSEKANTPSREREINDHEVLPHERRSSRLESRRKSKPGEEESGFSSGKEVPDVVRQFLEPFIMKLERSQDDNPAQSFSPYRADVGVDPNYNESNDVIRFTKETLKNYGTYDASNLLLEEVANKPTLYKDSFGKLLELEKLTRHWGTNRSPECNLFLAELYYDLGCSSNPSSFSEFMAEVSYHLCKIIEFVALDYPFPMGRVSEDINSYSANCVSSIGASSLTSKRPFWVRFFWISGRLSIFEGNVAKAQQELCLSLSLLENKENTTNSLGSVSLPHCKLTKELTVNRILHEISLLEVGFLLKKDIREMTEKENHIECISLLAPLLFSTKDAPLDVLCTDYDKGEELASVELSALDVLIQACKKVEPMDSEVLLSCYRRKLQILLVGAGMCIGGDKYVSKIDLKSLSAAGTQSNETRIKHSTVSIAELVRSISRLTSQLKKAMDSSQNLSSPIAPIEIASGIQSLLVALMCGILNLYLPKSCAEPQVSDGIEKSQRSCFIDAAIAFCKLQHLNINIPIKTQVELVVAVHDFLAEYGLCCASGDGDVEEGTFLKFAINHLLFLDMKLKSIMHSSDKGEKRNNGTSADQPCSDTVIDTSTLKVATKKACTNEGNSGENVEMLESGQFEKLDMELTEEEMEDLELALDTALDQCFFCLYGLNLRSDSGYEDDLAQHRNTSRGDYQTKEQCADVFQYILPYAKASSKTGLVKLRKVLRAIRKHFPQPTEDVLARNAIDKFLDDPNLCEDKLSEEAGSDGFLDSILKIISPDGENLKQLKSTSTGRSDPYLEVYGNLYHLLTQSEDISASDKWAGFVLTKEGEEFVEQNAKLFKYDLMYNPLRIESWQRLANHYDEEVDLLLNDGSKQINVASWRNNAALRQRVEASRRRSRRCFLVTLALAKEPLQQGEMHELLALVYYDGIQNVVPFYDQRSGIPTKDASWTALCHNSMWHFKKAFSLKEDWSHAFYIGKLCEKLGCSLETSFSYYEKAVNLNPSAVDVFYRMHASRLKLLGKGGKRNKESLKVVSDYCFSQSTKETIATMASRISLESSEFPEDNLEEVWDLLYKDCLSALEICVDGDLKHFHKARYMLAQGLYRRKNTGDLERAKDQLSFCFKSSRSSFTINMWEIDSTVKKGRRKTPGLSGNRKILEVHLPESSRKFITSIRKYILFYWKLLEETGDIAMLDRAYISLRADKRFSLCLEDLVPVALGRYVSALISSMTQSKDTEITALNSCEQLLEKMFSLFVEQMNLWSDLCNLPEIRRPELSESSLYGYLYQYIQLLEKEARVEVLEGMSEKIRKRFKNPKLASGNCAKVYKKISIAWYRSLVVKLALITSMNFTPASDPQVLNQLDMGSENTQFLCVDLQENELCTSPSEDPEYLKDFESKWKSVLSLVKNVIIKKAAENDLDTVATLLRSCYHLSRDSSFSIPLSGVKLYVVPPQSGVNIIDIGAPKKLLLWAHTLLHGYYTNISAVVKQCEENAKSKTKKGSTPQSTTTPIAAGCVKDGGSKQNEPEASPSMKIDDESTYNSSNAVIMENPRTVSSSPHVVQCIEPVVVRSETGGADPDRG